MISFATYFAPAPTPIETLQKPTVGNCPSLPTVRVGLTAQSQYLRDLDAMDPHDACFFCGYGEVIARRLHGTA
jgi:hypothetical protein